MEKILLTEPIFLEGHYTETKKRIQEFADKKNKELEEKFPESSGKRTLKRTHIKTMEALVDMYFAVLKRNAKNKMVPKDSTFRMSNKWLVTKEGGFTTKKTAWEHIKRLTDCGFILPGKYIEVQNKRGGSMRMRATGTNSSYEMALNPELLAAAYNYEFSELLVNISSKFYENGVIPVDVLKSINDAQPSFSDHPTGCMITFSNHICIWNLYPDHNNNSISGKNFSQNPEILTSLLPSASQQERPADSQPKHRNTETHGGIAQDAKLGAGANNSGAGGLKHQTIREKLITRAEINYYSILCWNIALSVFSQFWKVKVKRGTYSPHQIASAQNFIAKLMIADVNKNISPKQFYEQFTKIILTYQKFVFRNAYAFIPPPDIYFNPHLTCADGSPAHFMKSKMIYEQKFEPKIKDNHAYNKNIKLLNDCLWKMYKNPNIETYRQASQALAKKKNDFFLKTFNEFCENVNSFSPELLREKISNHHASIN